MLYNFLASSEKPHSVQCNKSSRERQRYLWQTVLCCYTSFLFTLPRHWDVLQGRDAAVALWEQTEGQTNTVNFH